MTRYGKVLLLIVPAQTQWNVPEQRAYGCLSCCERFIRAAKVGTLVPAENGRCQLAYEGTCEQRECVAS